MSIEQDDIPNSGSDEARKLGCICPVLDNCHGHGDGPFWIIIGCPLHMLTEKQE